MKPSRPPRSSQPRRRPRSERPASLLSAETESGVRLQKVLAMAGLGSRRQCEELILEGRVEVDGQVVAELGTRVDPETQKVLVDGERLKSARYQYYAINKPPGVVSTTSDPAGRTRVIDLIKTDHRVYNVGRLDKSSEGLILVTNDGDLANKLTHPRYGVEKTYLIQTVGVPTPEQLAQLEKGIFLAEGKAKARSARIIRCNKIGAIIEIVLNEGKNREIRRLLARLGHKVTRLQRVAIGPIGLGPMDVGEHRKLTAEEVRALKDWAPAPKSGRSVADRKASPSGPRREQKSGAGGRSSFKDRRPGREAGPRSLTGQRRSEASSKTRNEKSRTRSDNFSDRPRSSSQERSNDQRGERRREGQRGGVAAGRGETKRAPAAFKRSRSAAPNSQRGTRGSARSGRPPRRSGS